MRVWPALCLALITLPCVGDPAEPPAASAPPPRPADSPPSPAAGKSSESKTPENVRILHSLGIGIISTFLAILVVVLIPNAGIGISEPLAWVLRR